MPNKPTPTKKSQTAPIARSGVSGSPFDPIYQLSKSEISRIPVPVTARLHNKAQSALEAIANGSTTDTPAPFQIGSTATEEAQRVTIYPSQGPSGAGGSAINAQAALEFVQTTTPGMALDAYLAKLVKQNEDNSRRIKTLEAAVAELTIKLAQLAAKG